MPDDEKKAFTFQGMKPEEVLRKGQDAKFDLTDQKNKPETNQGKNMPSPTTGGGKKGK